MKSSSVSPVESVSHIKAVNGISFPSDYENLREFESLIQDCREFPGDESYRLHLADYILEKWGKDEQTINK